MTWKYPGVYWCKSCHRVFGYAQAKIWDYCLHANSTHVLDRKHFRPIEL